VTEGEIAITVRTDGKGNATAHVQGLGNAVGGLGNKAQSAAAGAKRLFEAVTAPGEKLEQVKNRMNALLGLFGVDIMGDFLAKGLQGINKLLDELNGNADAARQFERVRDRAHAASSALAAFALAGKAARQEAAALAADVAKAEVGLAKMSGQRDTTELQAVARLLELERDRLKVAQERAAIEEQIAAAGKAFADSAALVEVYREIARQKELLAALDQRAADAASNGLEGANLLLEQLEGRRMPAVQRLTALEVERAGLVANQARAGEVLADAERKRVLLGERSTQQLREQAMVIRSELLPEFLLMLETAKVGVALAAASTPMMTAALAAPFMALDAAIERIKRGLAQIKAVSPFEPRGSAHDSGLLRGLQMPGNVRVRNPADVPDDVGLGAGLGRLFSARSAWSDDQGALTTRLAEERARVEREAGLTIAGLEEYRARLDELMSSGALSESEMRQAFDQWRAADKRIVDIAAERETRLVEITEQGAIQRAAIRQREIDGQIASMEAMLGRATDAFMQMEQYGSASDQLFATLAQGARALAANWGDIVAKKDGVIQAMAATTTAGMRNERLRAGLMVLAASADAGIALARGNIPGFIAATGSIGFYAAMAGGAGAGGGGARGRAPVQRTANAVDGVRGGTVVNIAVNAPWFGPSMQEFGRYLGGIVRAPDQSGFN